VTQLGGDETLAGDERATAPPDGTPRAAPERGDTIGRFIVLHRKGGGSMGVVYAAYIDGPTLAQWLATRTSSGDSERTHPSVAALLANLGSAEAWLGRHADCAIASTDDPMATTVVLSRCGASPLP